MVDLRRRKRRRVAAWAWPTGLGLALAARYGTESLRHRRESGHGYDLHGADELDVRDPGFLRAAEALTGAPISWGDDVELLLRLPRSGSARRVECRLQLERRAL